MSRSASAIAAAAALALVATLSGGAATNAPPTPSEVAALAAPPSAPPLASERIYFVLTDRYANGDPSNDTGGVTGVRSRTGFDPTSTGFFHGGDFRGLTGTCTDPKRGLARIRALGFNAIWVTPPFVNQVSQGDSAGYHGYWGLDFTRVDPHLGSDDDFAAFVSCAHSLGIKVILDVVVNHTGDVIQLTGGSRYSDAPYRDCRGRVFRPAAYVGKSTFPCLSAQRMPHVPFVFPPLAQVKKPAWLNDPLNYHDRGDVDFGSCSEQCFEQGDFFGLDDLFTEKPNVERGLAQMYADWVTRYKLDGFRVDTARHVNAGFFELWVPQIMAAARAAGVPDFQIFGEVYLTDAIELSRYVRDRGLPSVLDFPFQQAAANYVSGQAGARGLADRLADDDYFRTANGVAPVPPTFLGNHDMGRAAQQIQSRSGAHGDELLRRVLLGYDVLYLLRGAPVVYYGDEVGMIGSGGDQQARQDMFPTQVDEWKTQERVGSSPIGDGSSFDAQSPIETRLRELGALRDAVPALSTGASVVRLAQKQLLAVSRIDTAGRREFLAVFNSGTAPARVTLQTATRSAAWTALLGTAAGARSDTAGRIAVEVPALSSLLLRADGDPDASSTGAPTLKVGPDDLTELVKLQATTRGGPQSVTFAIRRGSGAWTRVAVDDGAPYRAFLEPVRFRKREQVQVVAVARALDGQTATSQVVTVTPRP